MGGMVEMLDNSNLLSTDGSVDLTDLKKDRRIDSIQKRILSSYQTTMTNISPNILSAQRLRLNLQARLFISIYF
jgi:hypothetical protein